MRYDKLDELETAHPGINRIYAVLLILVMGGAIYGPLLYGVWETDRETSSQEQRHLATLPPVPLSTESLLDFPAKVNDYYADHFGFREPLVYRYFRMERQISGAEKNDITRGADDWYFLGRIGPGFRMAFDPMGDVINVNLYTEEELKQFGDNITSVRDWLAERNIEYIYMIAPNKHTIYFDKLPPDIKKVGEQSATDQLVNYLRNHTDVHVLDIRKEMQAAREAGKWDLYYKTDTHWNYYGANFAQYELFKYIETLFPGKVKPRLLSDDEFEVRENREGDLATVGHIDNAVVPDPIPVLASECEVPTREYDDHHYLVSSSCASKALKAVIFRDSYFRYMIPYSAEQFEQMVTYKARVTFKELAKAVAETGPDLVIEEIVERKLPYVHQGLDPDAKPLGYIGEGLPFGGN